MVLEEGDNGEFEGEAGTLGEGGAEGGVLEEAALAGGEGLADVNSKPGEVGGVGDVHDRKGGEVNIRDGPGHWSRRVAVGGGREGERRGEGG